MLTRRLRSVAHRHRPRPVARARQRLPKGRDVTAKAVQEIDDRLGIAAKGTSRFLDKLFPDHWSFFLGEIALYSFLLLVLTGIFLTLYFVPSASETIYHGSYRPLDGQKVSDAYRSVMDLSFEVRAGLLMRQIHHWAADIFIGAVVVHMSRIFFTSAYRKPRDLNWYVGLSMLILAIFNGYFGYSLPDDLLSGAGVRIGYSIILSIPFLGSYLAFLTFGGNFPGQAYIPRFFVIHVFILPIVIIGLLSLHLLLVFHQEHTQFPGKHRKPDNVVGSPLWPNFTAKTSGLMLMVVGAIVVMGAAAQIDPIWQLGPYHPYKVSYASQPDWYLGWLEGVLRMMPSWEWANWGHTEAWVSFIPGVVLPAALFVTFYSWPAIERRMTGDYSSHDLLAPPRQRPRHTALGAGVFAFAFMAFFDGGDDVLAQFLHVSLESMVWALRVATVVVPLVVGLVTYKACLELQAVPSLRRPDRRLRVRLTQAAHYHAELEQLESDGADSDEPAEVPGWIEGEPEVFVDR